MAASIINAAPTYRTTWYELVWSNAQPAATGPIIGVVFAEVCQVRMSRDAALSNPHCDWAVCAARRFTTDCNARNTTAASIINAAPT